jgi:omega-6 fatty acid desaturase (delta-12 desaturase)
MAIVVIMVIMGLTIGLKRFVMIELPILYLAFTLGMWLFYIQHQFEDAYWDREDQWNYLLGAMHGSSYYKLPRIFQWFTGNIGFHHIHHLSPRIPNYYLQQCHDENPLFHQVVPLTFWQSLKAMSLKLWDEEQRKLVGFRDLKSINVQR